MLTGTLAVVGFFSSIIILIYSFFSSRNKERLALIEHGKDASIFNLMKDQSNNLKYGLVAIMIGVGILLGHLLSTQTDMEEVVAYFSMIFIFGGLGLVGFYFYHGRQKENEESV